MKYVAIINQPGCLPDGEPQEFECLDDARAFLCDEISQTDDAPFDAVMRLTAGEHVIHEGYVYEIQIAELAVR